ncbi:MAG: biotin--[acetyl-CoA-carboxylase] ligase [Myxococcota bacterium]
MPDRPPFDARRLDALLAGSVNHWDRLRFFDETTSTQDALRLDLEAAPLRSPQVWRIAAADAQTAGRGRTGARWTAPARTSLLLTVGGPLPLAAELWPRASLVAGLAVADAVARHAGVEVWLKWPNDLLVRAPDRSWRKLGGLLCERVDLPGGVPAWLCGVGLNVAALAPGEWPDVVAQSAASLDQIAPVPVSRESLAATVADEIRSQVLDFARSGGVLDVRRLEARLAFRGVPVELDLGPTEARVWAMLDGVAPNGMPRVRRLRGTDPAALGPVEEITPVSVVAAHSDPPWKAAARLD